MAGLLGSIMSPFIGNQPAPPDPNQVAATQAQYNQQAAQQGINANNAVDLNKTGQFGSSNAVYDANGNIVGQSSGLNAPLAGAANTLQGGLAGAAANMPTSVNYDMTTPQAIANANYQAQAAALAPQFAQQQNALNVNLAERGIPIQNTTDAQGNPTSIWGQANQNLNNSQDLAYQQAAANAMNQIPGAQATMTNTANQQAQEAGVLAGQNAGLIGSLNSLVPQTQTYNQQVAPTNYGQIALGSNQLAQQQYEANANSLGQALKGLGSIAMAPMTGGTSLLGLAGGALFGGGSSTSPGTAANGGWSTTTTPSSGGLFNMFG